jgi:peptidoglycan biosynthesis protein MviN/MurJ (putative lipid II flippase)
MLSRRLERFPWRPWGSSLVWSLIASLVMTIPVWWVSRQIDWLDKEVPFLLQLSVFMLAIAVGAVSFLLVAWRGQRAELDALIGLLPQRLLRFLPQFLQSRQ